MTGQRQALAGTLRTAQPPLRRGYTRRLAEKPLADMTQLRRLDVGKERDMAFQQIIYEK